MTVVGNVVFTIEDDELKSFLGEVYGMIEVEE
jgi:hypothetical protein